MSQKRIPVPKLYLGFRQDSKNFVDFTIKVFGKCNMYGIVYYIFIVDNIYLTTQTTLYIGPHLS